MASVDEAAFAKTELAGDLAAGVETLSLSQRVTFTKYVRLVLPLDGSVFWVKADILSVNALYGWPAFNAVQFDQPAVVETPANTIIAAGSLHYATSGQQSEDESPAVNTVVFTSLREVEDLNHVSPTVLYIATLPSGTRYAFSQRKSFYRQADLYHYVGTAVLPAMSSQVIDSPAGIDTDLIVSNSLPFWLQLNTYAPVGGTRCPVRLYPSYLIPDNLPPPYGAVHIAPEQTVGLQSSPFLGRTLGHDQLVADTVRVTFYGVRNAQALDFLDAVNQYSLDTDNIGMMSAIPVIRDDKRPQAELGVIAMKKVVDFQVSYFQSVARTIARQLILEAIPTFLVPGITPTPPYEPAFQFNDGRNSMYLPLMAGI